MRNGETLVTTAQRIEELEARLREAEETLDAIRSGEVDALVISGPEEEQIYTLKTAEHPYRVLVEAMSEGAVTLSDSGMILYCNNSFAALLKIPSQQVVGSDLSRFVAPGDLPRYEALFQQCQKKSAKGEVTLIAGDKREVPVHLSLSTLPLDEIQGISIVVTDLTEQKQQQELVASEKLLRSILDQAAEATVVCNEQGQIILASRRALELCACNPMLCSFDEMLPLLQGKDTPGEGQKKLTFSDILKSKELRGVETVFHRSDGQVLDLLVSAGLVLDLKGEMLGCVVTLIDITERRRVEAALSDSEARLRAIFDGTYEFIGLLSPDGIILEANRSALEWIGCTREQVIGRAFQDTPWWTHTSGASELVQKAIQRATNGEFVRQEVALCNPAGEVVVFDFSLYPIRDESGKVVLLVPEGRNITEQVTAHKALEAANRLKDEFLATLSHELRNPLNNIVGYADILLRSDETRQSAITRQAAERIHRNAEAQAQLVNDLLDLSRLQTGKLAVDRQPMNLAPIVNDAVQSVRGQAEPGLWINTNLTDEQLVVDADPVRVQQIIWNLVNNAMKFTPAGGRVTVSLSREGEEAKIVVADTGQGIDPYFLPHVFEMFRQYDAGITRPYGGMGIGLALVKQLVELHGGRVEAHSQGLGHGACFTVRFPLYSAIAPQSSAPVTSAENGQVLTGTRILLVDDSKDSLDMLRLLLANEGAVVTTATNGQEGLRLAKAADFDLIISDISMPIMDGYNLLKRLRTDQLRYKNVPAIALTGFGRDEDIEQARQAGFMTHLTKPLDFDHLLRLVRTSLRK